MIDWEKRISSLKDPDYDDWLEFFRRIPAADLVASKAELYELLPGDGYAALMRWIEIHENPSKMDKLYRGRLDKQQEEDIMDVAVGDNDEKFYETLIKKNVAQLNSSSISQQEVARLSQNINIFRKELREIRSRSVKKGTTLERVLTAAAKANSPRKTKKKPKPTKKSLSATTKKKKATPKPRKAVKDDGKTKKK